MLCTIGSVGQEGQDSLCNVQCSVMVAMVVMICSMLLCSVLHVGVQWVQVGGQKQKMAGNLQISLALCSFLDFSKCD